MKQLITLFLFSVMYFPLTAWAQCSGQYRLTYPSGSTTSFVDINNGSGTVSSSYCPTSAGTQQLVVAPASSGTVTLTRTYNGVTTTLQTTSTVAGGTYTFPLPTVSSQATYTLYSVIACNNNKNSTVTLSLAPTLSLASTLTTVCAGSSATLTATGSTSGSYTWTAPGMTTVTTNTGSLTVAPTATTTYTVTAPTSCSTTTTQTLTLTVPTLTASSSASSVCPGTTVTLSAASSESTATLTWTANGSTIGTGSSITVTPAASTTYRVTSSNPSGCSSTSFRDVPVTVGTPTTTVSPATPTIDYGATATMTASASFSNASYEWHEGSASGPVIGNAASLSVSPTQNKSYTVISTAGACTASRTVTVTVNQPLPVKLTSFTARWYAGAAALSWATATEQHSAYFAIERSFDGRTFTTLGRVEAAGNSSALRQYSYTDALSKPATTTYYRLRLVDLDGSVAYSPVQVLASDAAFESALHVQVLPNPIEQAAVLQVVAPGAGPASYTVYNALGQAVATQQFAAAAGLQELPLALPHGLAAGYYYLKLSQGGQLRTLSLQLR